MKAEEIVIVGGGSSGWMAATHFSTKLKNTKITLVESPNIPKVGVGESTVPPIVDFMRSLGIDEKVWMPRCNATYKSSICFQDFYQLGEPPFWYPFTQATIVAGRPTNRYWRHKHLTDPAYQDRYSLYECETIVPEVCRQGRTSRSYSETDYAYHFDAVMLGEFLKELAVKNGVHHVIDTVSGIDQNEDGSIRSVRTEGGLDITGDLFIDCTGFRSLLLGQALEEPYDSYGDCLFNDRAVALSVPYEDKESEMFSYTMCTALSSGWAWTIPLYHRIGTGYVYASQFQTEEEAEREFRKFLGEDRVKDLNVKHIKIRVGKHRRSWVKNCVAIGLSSGFIEPLESTGLQIVQGAVELLAKTLREANGYGVADVAVFNDSMTTMIEGIRDFLVCHFALTRREDSAYWRHVQEHTKISDELSLRLQLGRSFMADPQTYNLFDSSGLAGFDFKEGWRLILTGMNHMPFDHEFFRRQQVGPFEPHIVENMGAFETHLASLDKQRKQIAKLPSHYAYLKNKVYNGEA